MASGTRWPPRPEPASPSAVPSLALRRGSLSLASTAVMGVINATPDSFSDGGQNLDPGRAAAAAARMVAEGADLLDLGAESTRPGAAPVGAAEELSRLLPVLRAVRRAVAIPLSVDTMKAEVARVALGEGADLVNDVTAGRFDPDMLAVCAASKAPVVLMHMQGTPATMQQAPCYTDVIGEVRAFLAERARVAEAAGVSRDAIVLDPGIGFGKTPIHNCALLSRLDLIAALGYPILVGVSRKGFLGELLGGRPAEARGFGTAAAVAVAVLRGARIVRVHDVGPARDVVRVAEAIGSA